jgi:hypothetical protein
MRWMSCYVISEGTQVCVRILRTRAIDMMTKDDESEAVGFYHSFNPLL